MIRQPITRVARRAKLELARQTIGRVDLPERLSRDHCPVCGYQGRFLSRAAVTGTRRRAQCPRCGALERHRIQQLVYRQLADSGLLHGRLLEVAPEPFTRRSLHPHFASVHTTDLLRTDVTLRTDLTSTPFADATFDVVVASHVLEHIPDDAAAIAEISRIVRPGGIAVLPVPIVNAATVEYSSPNRFEDFHVRAPGPDYYDRYIGPFESVQLFTSADFDPRHQVDLIEDRSIYPNERFPQRQAAAGDAHGDIVAVAHKQASTAHASPITSRHDQDPHDQDPHG